jgi:acyl dehydratase
MRIFDGFDEIKSAVGSEIGVSDWIEITQDRINRFAEATCDQQWIHVDQERAKGGASRRPHHRAWLAVA